MEDQVAYVRSPTGELGQVPAAELGSALQNGFTQAAPEEVDAWHREEKYGTGTEQLKTGLEGAANAATFGLSTGLQTGLGISTPEDIMARREVNPGAYMTGQVAGLVGSSFIPAVGAANLLTKAGAGAAKIAGVAAAETALGKIGSAAVRAGVENAVFQGGDEVAKMLASDPHQSVETAITNVGLSGVLGLGVGGALGAVNPLWKVTMGGKVGSMLDSVKNKAGGIDGTIDDAVHDATQKLGLELGPEVKASLSNDPWVQSAAKGLQQSDTTATGRSFQEKLKAFKEGVNDSILGAFGKTRDDLLKMQELSKYESGKSIGDTLANEIDQRISPLAKEFDDLKGKYQGVELPKDVIENVPYADPNNLTQVLSKDVVKPGVASTLSQQVAELAERQGWLTASSGDAHELVTMVMKDLPRQKTLKDLGNFITRVGETANKEPLNFPRKRIGEMLKGVLQEGEADVIMKALGEKGPEHVERYAAARNAWREQAKLVNSIDDRLKIRGSTSSFARNVREMASTDAETLLNRLSGKGDADLLKVLQENFPETANAVRQFHLDQVLKTAADKAAPGELISAKKLVSAIDSMSPELRAFSISPEALEKVGAAGSILEQLAKAPHNHSNTARTMDKLFEYIPATAVGMATMVAGGNPLMAGALGALTKYMSKDAPDAVKLAMLKFMASGQPIEAGAFKATVDVIEQTIKGENAVRSSVRKVFKSTREVVPTKTDRVSERSREKLDKKVVELSQDPEGMLGVGGESAYYLPEHATALAYTASNVVGYLKSIRPNTDPKAPLDARMKPSQVQKSAYDRALDIAEDPLLVLNDIQDGTLTSKDVVALQRMYPALYQKLSGQLMEQVVDLQAKDEEIPYAKRMALSLFLKQPLDSTMTPAAIMAHQMPAQESQGQMAPKQGSVQKLGKMAEMSATPGQARELANLKS